MKEFTIPKACQVFLAIFSFVGLVVSEYCDNTANSRGCWGEYNISTDYTTVIPYTGVTREYWLSVQNVTLAPDGYERLVLAANGTYPGPLIEANWGDDLVIHVTNELENNGTAIHWHGIRQLDSNEYDGVPGVTQCPIAPGNTMTYKFRATQYGTSWYHSHWSIQMADGLYGPIVIHGPTTADYDVDLGPVFITDWFHETAFSLWESKAKHGAFPTNVDPENGLINGTNTYPCEESDDPACTGSGRRSQAVFEKGKKYLLRVIDGETDGFMKFSIDGHKLTVVAMDLVPIVPYETESIILTSGQRYDVIVEANQEVGSYWMRAIYQTACNELGIDRNDIKGVIRYEGSTDEGSPTTTQWASITNSCGDEPYASLVPYVAKTVGAADKQENLDVGWFYSSDLVFHWTLNTKALTINWGQPTDLLITQNQSVFPSDYNTYEIPADQDWTYWVIEDFSLVDVYHPFHLHGHDFYVLAQGSGAYSSSVTLNRNNPPRRDTATMSGNGYLVIAFENDNPGSWLMHCHIAWHSSQNLALQFVELSNDIPGLFKPVQEQYETTCESWNEYYKDALYRQDDSGV